MATIYKRNGRSPYWYAKGVDAWGHEWRESTRCKDREAAKRTARQIERRRAAEADQAPRISLKQGLENVLAQDERAGRSDATRDVHTTKGRHLMRLLGKEYDIASVSAEDLQWYADTRLSELVYDGGDDEERARTTSRHTVHKELGVLRLAVRQSGLTWDRKLLPDLGTYYEPRDRWLTMEQYRKLYTALNAGRRDYLVAFCFTGMDEGPLYRVKAGHVDIKRQQVWCPDTKTKSRARWIPLHDEALEVFARRAERPPGEHGELFPKWGNSHRDLRAACKRAGIEPVSAKDLRRTFCSWMAQAGVPMKACADLMGHSSLRMVEQVYARLGVDVYRDAISALPSVRRSDTKCVRDARGNRDTGDT